MCVMKLTWLKVIAEGTKVTYYNLTAFVPHKYYYHVCVCIGVCTCVCVCMCVFQEDWVLVEHERTCPVE
jgi:hypothetical protein